MGGWREGKSFFFHAEQYSKAHKTEMGWEEGGERVPVKYSGDATYLPEKKKG